MPTKLSKPVVRETIGTATIFDTGQDRPLIASLEPPGVLTLRLKGTRGREVIRLSLASLYLQGVRRG